MIQKQTTMQIKKYITTKDHPYLDEGMEFKENQTDKTQFYYQDISISKIDIIHGHKIGHFEVKIDPEYSFSKKGLIEFAKYCQQSDLYVDDKFYDEWFNEWIKS